jgi:hypothetical protein
MKKTALLTKYLMEHSHPTIDCQSLKIRMRRAGLSYRRVAPLIGCHFSYLSDILNGRRLHPGYAVRQRLADLISNHTKQPSSVNH